MIGDQIESDEHFGHLSEIARARATQSGSSMIIAKVNGAVFSGCCYCRC